MITFLGARLPQRVASNQMTPLWRSHSRIRESGSFALWRHGARLPSSSKLKESKPNKGCHGSLMRSLFNVRQSFVNGRSRIRLFWCRHTKMSLRSVCVHRLRFIGYKSLRHRHRASAPMPSSLIRHWCSSRGVWHPCDVIVTEDAIARVLNGPFRVPQPNGTQRYRFTALDTSWGKCSCATQWRYLCYICSCSIHVVNSSFSWWLLWTCKPR